MALEPEYYFAKCNDCYWEGSNQQTEQAARREKDEHERTNEVHNPVVMRVFDDGSKGIV